MPVSLTKWWIRIGRFIQDPPDINRREMIQRFLERWKAKKEKSKIAASQSCTQSPCPEGSPSCTCTSETSLSPPTISTGSGQSSSVIQGLAEPLNLKRSCFSWYRPSGTSLIFRRFSKPSWSCFYWYRVQHMSFIIGGCAKPPESSVPPKTWVREHKSCRPETPSCTVETNPMPSIIKTCSSCLSCITRVLAESLNLRRSSFYWYRPPCPSSVTEQYCRPAETSLPPKTKEILLGSSPFPSVLSSCRSKTSCTVGGFCHLYLPMILLMRAGDIETNPGPERIVSDEEFIKLSKLIAPSYYKELGVHLDIPNAELCQIITQHMLNYSDALMTVFTRWRNKQLPGTNIRAVLAERLERSGLGGLSGELLTRSLVSAWTGSPVTTPGSQTQPLSPELIKRCADDFKLKYRTTLCKIRADPLDPDSLVQFEDMYTNLVLEEEYRKSKRPLEYKDLFNLKVNGEFPRRLMIQGEAGAGKTTFCAKIAWDWINGSPVLPNYVWVIIVPLREAKQYSIGEIAKSYLTKENPATAHQLTEYIRSNQKDVFIAFDGLDEFGGKLVQQRKDRSKSECLQPQSTEQTKARSKSKMNKKKRPKVLHLKSSKSTSATAQPRVNNSDASGSLSERGEVALKDILRSDELAACPVLVTSRPWKVTEIRWDNNLRKLYTFIYVEGFSKENVEVYIHKYFQEDEAKADQLIQLTNDNDIVSENMAPYPIYIAMLCLMWRELDDQKQEMFKSLQTFSQIFEEMFDFLKVHYAQKEITDLGSPSFTAYVKQIEKLMQPIAKLAFNGLQENTLVFKEDDFQHCSESMEKACRVGVLSQEKRLTSIYDKSSMYLQSTIFFPHKLFQEYMAGVHFASLYESDRNEFNRLMEKIVLPRKEEFRYLLYFTVSQNKIIANHVMKCLVQVDTSDQRGRDFLVDVSFESQDLDAAALMKNRVSSLTIDRTMTAHTVAGYVFTGIHLDLVNLGVHRECGPTMSHDLVEMICSAPSMQDVTLDKASFHSDFYAVLAKEGNKSKVQTLKLLYVQCATSATSENLAVGLCSMPNLIDLIMHGMDLNQEFFSTFKAKASTIQVQTLCLHDVQSPTPASSWNLAEALCSMANLTRLILWEMNLDEEFFSQMKVKASTLQVRTFRLLDVHCPTTASSHHLIEAVCSMPNLTDLALGGKNFSEDFFSTLKAKASALQVQALSLEELKFLTPASLQNLAEVLCSMPNLADLTLRDMDLNEEFSSTLKAKASSLQGSFPQISKGNFTLNGDHQADFDSLLQSLTDYRVYQREHCFDQEDDLIWTSQPSDYPHQLHMGNAQPSRLQNRMKCCSVL